MAYYPDLDENSACQVVEELLDLNSRMTAEAAISGAKRDANGICISWNLSRLPITALPECACHCLTLNLVYSPQYVASVSAAESSNVTWH